MRRDFVVVLRGLIRAPLFTLVSVLTLGIAIGGTTAIASFVRGILLTPLPYPDAGRLVTITRYNRAQEFSGLQVVGSDLAEVMDSSPSFSRISGLHYEDVNLKGGSGPEKATAAIVLPDLLPLLGIEASSGRVFLPEETEGSAILTHRLWMSRFGGSPDVIGSALTHDRGFSTIVGVLPPGVEIPLRKADLLLPMSPADLRDEEAPSLQVFARLAPGVALETARADVDAISRRIETEHDWPVKGWYLDVTDLRREIVGEVAPTIWMLQGAVALALLIACANFAGLLLARGVPREREIAVRRAMGAMRSQIARLLLAESLLLALMGGVLGLAIARWATSLFLALAPSGLPRSSDVSVDGAMLSLGVGIAVVSGLAAGAFPALVFSNAAPNRSTSRGSSRLRAALTVAQLAAALTLTIGCGLLTTSLVRLLSVDVGFEPEALLSLDVSFPRDRYPEASHRNALVRSLIERLEALSDVRAAGFAPWTPLTGSWSSAQMSVEDGLGTARERSRWPVVLSVSPGFFPAAGIPLVSGRGFQDVETGDVAIVNQKLAERAWPDGDAVGRRIKYGGPDSDNPWLEIVGVVTSSRLVGLATEEAEATFHPLLPLKYPYPTLSLLVRTRSEPMSAVPSVRAAISEIDPEIPLADIRRMDDILADNATAPRFRLLVVASFTALALGLAGIGIYGVVAQWAAARRREIGVRMALGADRRSVLRLVMEQGAVLVALGTLLGVLGSLAAARLLEAFLFEVSASDPLTWILAVLFLAAVTAAAALIPARRAASIDPAEALRAE
jgi:predicted permease